MFTNNYYKAVLPSKLLNRSYQFSDIEPAWAAMSEHIYGSSVYCSENIENLLKQRLSKFAYGTGNVGTGYCFGSGNTPATVNDTTLSGDFIDTSSYNVSVSVNKDNSTQYMTNFETLYTITNISSEDITIGEVALCYYMQGRKTSNASMCYCPWIIERTALETPITIPAGGVGQVTYTICVNHSPTA